MVRFLTLLALVAPLAGCGADTNSAKGKPKSVEVPNAPPPADPDKVNSGADPSGKGS